MDVAASAQEAHLARVLEEHRAGMPQGESLYFCIVCGERIPDARRQAIPGCRRCVNCQGQLERES